MSSSALIRVRQLIRSLDKPEYFFNLPQLLRRVSIGMIPPKAELKTFRMPWGTQIEVRANENIGRALARLGVYDLVVCETLWRLLESGDAAVDAGANVGVLSSLIAARIGEHGKLYSFEPHPRLFLQLEKNVRTNQNVVCVNEALSDRAGEGELFIPAGFDSNEGLATLASNGPEGSVRRVPVKLTLLDSFFEGEPPPKLMKIDVEGHELAVLRGAEGLLRSGSLRNIVFEDHGPYPSSTFVLLRSFGYEIKRLTKAFMGPVLTDPTLPAAPHPWEPPSFLATLELSDVERKFRAKGWQVLRPLRSR